MENDHYEFFQENADRLTIDFDGLIYKPTKCLPTVGDMMVNMRTGQIGVCEETSSPYNVSYRCPHCTNLHPVLKMYARKLIICIPEDKQFWN